MGQTVRERRQSTQRLLKKVLWEDVHDLICLLIVLRHMLVMIMLIPTSFAVHVHAKAEPAVQ